jgi:hypothetical protein
VSVFWWLLFYAIWLAGLWSALLALWRGLAWIVTPPQRTGKEKP